MLKFHLATSFTLHMLQLNSKEIIEKITIRKEENRITETDAKDINPEVNMSLKGQNLHNQG